MRLPVSLIAVLLMATVAQAASFDCRKATSKMEHAVCGNPTLSGLDESLAAAYREAKARLSPKAAKTFAAGQGSWHRFTSTYCFTNYSAEAVTQGESNQCLIKAYQQRIKEIEATGKMIAGFKTYLALENRIKVSPKEQFIYTVERRYIQLDDDSSLGAKLNDFLAFKDKVQLEDSRGSEAYTVTLANPSKDWLCKETTADTFIGPYPNTSKSCGAYAISLGRPLFIRDLFSGQEWTKIAIAAARRHFAELARKNPEFTLDMVIGYDQFQLKPDQVFPYCFGARGIYVDGFMVHAVKEFDGVTIPWETFGKVLTPYARQQIRSLTDN